MRRQLLLIVTTASVAYLDARSTGDQEVTGSTPLGRQHSYSRRAVVSFWRKNVHNTG